MIHLLTGKEWKYRVSDIKNIPSEFFSIFICRTLPEYLKQTFKYIIETWNDNTPGREDNSDKNWQNSVRQIHISLWLFSESQLKYVYVDMYCICIYK